MRLETSRLLLRDWELNDAPSLFKHAANQELAQSLGKKPHTTIAESEMHIQTHLQAGLALAITLKDQPNIPIGAIELVKPTENLAFLKANDSDLIYWLGKDFHGQGIMTEALITVCNFAFEELGFENIWCRHLTNNIRATRLEIRLGFKHIYTEYDVLNNWNLQHQTIHYGRISQADWRKN